MTYISVETFSISLPHYSFRISVPLQNPKVRAKRNIIRHNFDNVRYYIILFFKVGRGS